MYEKEHLHDESYELFEQIFWSFFRLLLHRVLLWSRNEGVRNPRSMLSNTITVYTKIFPSFYDKYHPGLYEQNLKTIPFSLSEEWAYKFECKFRKNMESYSVYRGCIANHSITANHLLKFLFQVAKKYSVDDRSLHKLFMGICKRYVASKVVESPDSLLTSIGLYFSEEEEKEEDVKMTPAEKYIKKLEDNLLLKTGEIYVGVLNDIYTTHKVNKRIKYTITKREFTKKLEKLSKYVDVDKYFTKKLAGTCKLKLYDRNDKDIETSYIDFRQDEVESVSESPYQCKEFYLAGLFGISRYICSFKKIPLEKIINSKEFKSWFRFRFSDASS